MRSPHLLFILTDQHLATTLGCYGSTLVSTPHIDALARDGLLFTNAYAACPICTPARASLQTGLLPFRHGAYLSLIHLNPAWQAVPPLILAGDSWSEEAFRAWVKRERPDVVLTEEQAVNASLAALRSQIPQDLGLIFYHKPHPLPRLTGLEVDYQHVGVITAQVLMRLIETNERGPAKVPTTTLVKSFVWHPGQTVRRPKTPRRASSP